MYLTNEQVSNKNNQLKIDLYHGTSTLFIESIIKNGLGGVNPVEDWKLLELGREVFDLSKIHLRNSELFERSSASFQNMTEQTKTGSFNWQHGATYLSPAEKTAVSYATRKQYGSELLTYTLEFLRELINLKISYVTRDLYQRHSKVFNLIEARPSPILIQVKDVFKDSLLNELGEDPTSSLQSIEKEINDFPETYEDVLQQCNFRLTKAIPASQLKFWLINITEWNQFSPAYKLYELKKPKE
ncbi:hypothetical protein [Pontibacter harenae]|uniref:hypothetical protein n=1 Tax=Pontibacter harenae TaxID=2894083 RepID=UPI001E4616D1|nr:hypothetical protein [Pontibacter harenae]